ncbi:hypothetical protein QCA50_009915 [Cerrena zonata]|uniref:Uncharacterized protein n=1 Tax=Cerrena zonata TaxID=2478898 RepID=A0AAW0G6T4_9APHY
MANARHQEYNAAAATAAAAVSALSHHPDDPNQFSSHSHHLNPQISPAEAAAQAAQLQQHQLSSNPQLQQFQQVQAQQLAAAQQQQQHQHHQQQQHHQQHPLHQAQDPYLITPSSAEQPDFNGGSVLVSRYADNEVIKTFGSKPDLVKYVKNILSDQEQCKIVINSSKPKAVYFQCERSGSFRTTVKEPSKRQRVAYTKRNKCGYRLVANLYPPKTKRIPKKPQSPGIQPDFSDGNIDAKIDTYEHQIHHPVQHQHQQQNPDYDDGEDEIWVLRMIHPAHNHPLEPGLATGQAKKKRSKFSRTLVEKPLNRTNGTAAAAAAAVAQAYNPNELLDPQHQLAQHHLAQQQLQQHQYQQQLAQQAQHHGLTATVPHTHHHTHHDPTAHGGGPSVQDVAVIAAMGGDASSAAAAAALHEQHVDPNIDPNVDPSVQEHDHSHRIRLSSQIHAPDRQDYEPITEQPSIAKSPLKEDPEEDQPEPTNYPPTSSLVV